MRAARASCLGFGRRRLAVLEAATEAETLFGGRTRAWAPAASVWVRLEVERAAEQPLSGSPLPPPLLVRATAEARDHPAAARGQVLALDGRRWRVTAVRRAEDGEAAGTMRLSLEREVG